MGWSRRIRWGVAAVVVLGGVVVAILATRPGSDDDGAAPTIALAPGAPPEFSWEDGHPTVVLPGELVRISRPSTVMQLEAWVSGQPGEWQPVAYYTKVSNDQDPVFDGPFAGTFDGPSEFLHFGAAGGFAMPIADSLAPGWYRFDGTTAFRVADPETVALDPELPARLCGLGPQDPRFGRTRLLKLLATEAKAADPESYAGAWIDPNSRSVVIATVGDAAALDEIVVQAWEASGRAANNRPQTIEVENSLKELNQARRRLNRKAKAADGFATAYVDKQENQVRLALDRNVELSYDNVEQRLFCARWSYDPDLNQPLGP